MNVFSKARATRRTAFRKCVCGRGTRQRTGTKVKLFQISAFRSYSLCLFGKRKDEQCQSSLWYANRTRVSAARRAASGSRPAGDGAACTRGPRCGLQGPSFLLPQRHFSIPPLPPLCHQPNNLWRSGLTGAGQAGWFSTSWFGFSSVCIFGLHSISLGMRKGSQV